MIKLKDLLDISKYQSDIYIKDEDKHLVFEKLDFTYDEYKESKDYYNKINKDNCLINDYLDYYVHEVYGYDNGLNIKISKYPEGIHVFEGISYEPDRVVKIMTNYDQNDIK